MNVLSSVSEGVKSRETIPYAKSIILSLITTHRKYTILPFFKNSLTG